MSVNRQIVEKYMDGFRITDHAMILSCLTDDVEWLIPGAFQVFGKDAFDSQIENDAFTGNPVIEITRMVEEGDVVVAEGTVKTQRKDGETLNLVFCDVFVMKDGLIRKLTSYLMTVE